MRAHPLAEEYPTTSQKKLDEITEAMRERGFDRRFPIVIFKRRILDGRTRDAAAKAAKVKPKYIVFKGTDEQARDFVETANLLRRQLTPAQEQERREARIVLVAELHAEGKSQRAIADAVGVSQPQVKADLEAATDKGLSVEPKDGVITGKDGKKRVAKKPITRCSRCARLFPNEPRASLKNCLLCKTEREAQRLDNGSATRRNGRAHGGKPAFDYRPLRDGYGQCMRQHDVFGRLFGVKETPEAEQLRNELANWYKHFVDWCSRVSRTPAPSI